MIIDLHAHYVPRSFLEAIEFDMGLLDPAGPVRALRPLARADRDAILGGVAAELLKL